MNNKTFFVEWFLGKDPIEFFESREKAWERFQSLCNETIVHPLYGRKYDLSVSYIAVGEIEPTGRKAVQGMCAYEDVAERYREKIKKEYEVFSDDNIIEKAKAYYARINS